MKQTITVKKGKTSEGLYFIAVIPPEHIKLKVSELKRKIAEEFNTFHALKSPPHITLVPPFNFAVDSEKEMFQRIITACRTTHAFKIELIDLGAFKPRVIYITITRSEKLEQLHHNLMKHFTELESRRKYKPHMTLAFRALSPDMFHKAWKKYRSLRFQEDFAVSSIFLLKHNSKFWEVYREFQFG